MSAAPTRAWMLDHTEANLPTRFGMFRAHGFAEEADGKEHLALVHGEVLGAEDVPVRIHSECITGDVFGSLRCELRRAARHGGIGLSNKLRAYRLQELGLDTLEANVALGFREDERDYRIAALILSTLGVESVALMTNSPDKLQQLRRLGVRITRRIRHSVRPGVHNATYLDTKARRAGHLLDLDEASS